uniref:HDC07490 n=1 Tax=Drosophila melanogaster TaxID=7227 RepID=Q6IM49_DROME|nr:TPA_inf: HDC07490 [Drosophila melanogaster]
MRAAKCCESQFQTHGHPPASVTASATQRQANKHKGRRMQDTDTDTDTNANTDWEHGRTGGSGIWSKPSVPLNAADILRSLFICLACTSNARN